MSLLIHPPPRPQLYISYLHFLLPSQSLQSNLYRSTTGLINLCHFFIFHDFSMTIFTSQTFSVGILYGHFVSYRFVVGVPSPVPSHYAPYP